MVVTDIIDRKLRVARTKFRPIMSTNYDVSNTCNLTCEGCYYFVSGQKTYNKRLTFAEYDTFFAKEVVRGINYPLFSGGEPSLNVVALRAGAKHWPHGIIYTNGVKKIPKDVPFRIAISVWGARERNESVRGEQSYDRAFETAEGDPRALIYMTINRDNVGDIEEVVADCVRRGLKVSFNNFSKTTEYIRLLESGCYENNPYMRSGSTNESNISLRFEDRLRVAEILDRLIDQYPDTLIFTKLLNDWMHRRRAIHSINVETGLATDCAYLKAPWHRGYDFSLNPLKGKACCAPELDCTDCRIHPTATFTLMMRLTERMRRSEIARRQLTVLRESMMRFHFWDWEWTNVGPEASANTADLGPA